MRCPWLFFILVIVSLCLTIIVTVSAQDAADSTGTTTVTTHERTWQTPVRRIWEQKHRIIFNADEWVAEGDRAKQGGDYEEALGSYNTAIDQITNSQKLSDPEKNKKLAEIYRHKAELYRVRQQWGDDALAARADEKAESYIEKGTYSGPCPVYLTYHLTPLAGTVELVRDFRDGSVMKTYTGSRFMAAFNAWYHTFSPGTSDYIRDHPLARSLLVFGLAPLLLTVLLSQGVFTLTGFSTEFAVVCTLITGGTLIGVLYIVPPVSLGMIAAAGKGWRIPGITDIRPLAVLWLCTLVTLCTGIFLTRDLVTVVSSGMLVLCTMALAGGAGSLALCRFLLGDPALQRVRTPYRKETGVGQPLPE